MRSPLAIGCEVGAFTIGGREILVARCDGDPYGTVGLFDTDAPEAALGVVAGLNTVRPTVVSVSATWSVQQRAQVLGEVQSAWRAFELEVLA